MLSLTRFARKHALSLIVSYYQHQSCRLLIPHKTHAKTSTTLLVRQHINCGPFLTFLEDGGWLSSHPLPADKSSFGNFESLAQENKQIIKNILESTASISPVDEQILSKIRGFYSSCLDEDTLDKVGVTPLLRFVSTVRKLFNENSTDIASQASNPEAKTKGLTAALAFLHSRGG
jgi:endothelin-converting enzyme